MPPKCWLCINNSDETAQKLNSFVLQNIACMDVESLTSMLHSHLEQHFQQNMINAEGASREDIKQHIQGSHLLCPSLQLAHNIRSVLEIRDTLKSMVISQDEEGNKTVDSKNMSHYFKAVSEITQMYKASEMTKMLFYPEEKVASGRT